MTSAEPAEPGPAADEPAGTPVPAGPDLTVPAAAEIEAEPDARAWPVAADDPAASTDALIAPPTDAPTQVLTSAPTATPVSEPDVGAPAPEPAPRAADPPVSSGAGWAHFDWTGSYWRTPFLELHHSAGDAELHPLRGRICFATDWLIRLIAVLLAFAIFAAIIFKTVS